MADDPDGFGIIDRPHLREADGADFKEWFHFVILDAASGWDIVFNFSLRGNPALAGASVVDVILLCHHRAHGWCADIDPYEGAAARFAAEELDIAVGSTFVTFRDGRYHIRAGLRGMPLHLAAELLPTASPMMIWNNTPVGSGYLNWLVVPRLVADGELRAGGQTYRLSQAGAYHDHNWGRWQWGDDLGWDWGFCCGPQDAPAEQQITLVFDRTTDRTASRADAHTLAVWQGAVLLKTFSGSELRAERRGRFDPGRIPRRPAAANLVGRGAVLTVPRAFHVSAREGADWLDFTFEVDAALQIAIPKETKIGIVGLNETLGRVTASGSIGGCKIALEARGCFEFLA